MATKEPLLHVDQLVVEFSSSDETVQAVNGVSFTLQEGETIGIVGESGSGKSVTATSILRLIPSPPGRIAGGSIHFRGQDLVHLKEKDMLGIRGNDIAMIFQDPMTSLNPVFTVGDQLYEVIRLHQKATKKEAHEKAIELLKRVGIPEPEKRLQMYPHEFSGGMRQRVMIAMALSCNPKLLIADEPTTALDVTVQAQILDLMRDLQAQFNTSIMLITHDIGVVWEMCDKVIVMYAGHTVEATTVGKLYEQPLHPYTWGLLDSQISEDTAHKELLRPIPGSPPDMRDAPKGCPFATRCAYAEDVCLTEKPMLQEVDEGHQVACHFQTATSRLTPKERRVSVE
ncbi:ABC transporter ATP-binding protein [Aureibacillus halotolerans]|uniref:Peptide/nickel transport system ATP-binding protein/oligopeptide transport system ATP-binding protein n=1 Tax=Aureibacillus halotolerans TaxID=1508390 RepID=A0A4R6U0G4_9BACI|nr:ABC transporter ATP-binding protein [Aureibacillus halotolerans]TDQ36544.1 peptide/nickel transport system ATP-binding protein/oligopeptide transport system ATP-binding protein [Aureibacillus halotolerans]